MISTLGNIGEHDKFAAYAFTDRIDYLADVWIVHGKLDDGWASCA